MRPCSCSCAPARRGATANYRVVDAQLYSQGILLAFMFLGPCFYLVPIWLYVREFDTMGHTYLRVCGFLYLISNVLYQFAGAHVSHHVLLQRRQRAAKGYPRL